MPLPEREKFIDAQPTPIRTELRSLLEAFSEPDALLERGRQRIGPYEILRPLGQGGMAVVFAAARADLEFQKIVALKIVPSSANSDEIVQRFRNERQILASLDHPNICRLLDGGTTPEGYPYIVMELVEGEPADVYMRRPNLTLIDKLRVLQKVCSAVHFAHQNLVVHRDLKPSNIMVTEDGEPKLLDFGIAKIMSKKFMGAKLGVTMAGARPLTPLYASPEQLRGENITTASDIYTLGVVFYELLAGRHPIPDSIQTVTEIAAEILEKTPPPPSTIAGKELRGDLDMIILKAMRKEPERRYPSALSLSEDIERYLSGLPVTAQKDTTTYRISKFLRRHKTGVAAAAVVAISLATSTVVSLNYAAEANARSRDLQQIAHFMVFDLDTAMRDSGTAARKTSIDNALEAFRRLGQRSAGDMALQRDLMEAYLRAGDVQGNLYGANLGDRKGAIESYRQAAALAQRLNDKPSMGRAKLKLAEIESLEGDRKAALANYREARDLLSASQWSERVQASYKIGFTMHRLGQVQEALKELQAAVVLAEKWRTAEPQSREAKRHWAIASEHLGVGLAYVNRADDGIIEIKKALAMYEELRKSAPDNIQLMRDQLAGWSNLGDIYYDSQNAYVLASDAYLKAHGIAARLLAADPLSTQAQRDMHIALGRVSMALHKADRVEQAVPYARQAIEVLEPMVKRPDAALYDLQHYAYLLTAGPVAEVHDPCRAIAAGEMAVANSNSSDAEVLDTLADVYFAAGRLEDAVATERKALSLLSQDSDLRKKCAGNLARFEEALRKNSKRRSSPACGATSRAQ